MTQNNDPYSQFKAAQRESWANFIPLEMFTTLPAHDLVSQAGVKKGDVVLDVACGTGVAAITAAARGAKVCGLDLSPVLLNRARENAANAELSVEFQEGDVEFLPYRDAQFDIVMSQFGHMFAPRPEVAIAEMLRVLRPGGTLAFTTWPPELYTGRMFQLVGKYVPAPAGVAPPPLWGDPNIVRERLGNRVKGLRFDRGVTHFPSLSPKNYRAGIEKTAGPVIKLVESLKDQPEKLAQFRSELEALIAEYWKDNAVRQQTLITVAQKA